METLYVKFGTYSALLAMVQVDGSDRLPVPLLGARSAQLGRGREHRHAGGTGPDLRGDGAPGGRAWLRGGDRGRCGVGGADLAPHVLRALRGQGELLPRDLPDRV